MATMHFLDLDLDAFLSSVAHWSTEPRLDPAQYQPWAEARLRDFLERQCGLSQSRPIPGFFVEEHDAAFDLMRDLTEGQVPLQVVHVDAHADLGMGDPSWVDLIRHVAKPLRDRLRPKRAVEGLNPGSWVAYALAAELIDDLTYVHPARWGNDLTAIHFLDGDTASGHIQMKAFTRPGLPMDGSCPDYWALTTLPPDVALAPVPFRQVTLDDYRADRSFDVGLLCRSPAYTPPTSDALIPVIAEYIAF